MQAKVFLFSILLHGILLGVFSWVWTGQTFEQDGGASAAPIMAELYPGLVSKKPRRDPPALGSLSRQRGRVSPFKPPSPASGGGEKFY